MHGQDTLLPTTNSSVEEAVLQTQIETLQWQLTQVPINGLNIFIQQKKNKHLENSRTAEKNCLRKRQKQKKKKYDFLSLVVDTTTELALFVICLLQLD